MAQAIANFLSIEYEANSIDGIIGNFENGRLNILEQRRVEIELTIPVATGNAALPETPPTPAANHLQQLLAGFKSSWSSAILVIPAQENLSVHLELPFSDQKNIGRVIQPEVQDLLPFDVEEYLIVAKPVSNSRPNGYDIQVNLFPNRLMQDILGQCKSAEFEPQIVSPKASVLAQVLKLGPNYFAKNCALLWADGNEWMMIIAIDGAIREERLLGLNLASQAQDKYRVFLQEAKLCTLWAEQRYDQKIEVVYYFGDASLKGEIQAFLGRPTERVELKEFVQFEPQYSSIALLGIVCLKDHSQRLLSSCTNFRVGPFRYRPQFKELTAEFRTLLPYFFFMILTSFIALFGIYILRSNRISDLEDAIHRQIKTVIPEANVAVGDEYRIIGTELAKREEFLRSLGSLSRLSPLDLLLEVSKTLTVDDNKVIIDSIRIENNRLVIRGWAPTYAVSEEIEKALKLNKTFCQVSMKDLGNSSGFGGAGTYGFEVEVKTCE